MSYTSTAGIQDIASTALDVAKDPALSEVVSLVGQIKKSLPAQKAAAGEVGIGLKSIIPPLKIFVTYKKHPWIVPAFLGGLVLTIFSLGMMTEKARHRRKV